AQRRGDHRAPRIASGRRRRRNARLHRHRPSRGGLYLPPAVRRRHRRRRADDRPLLRLGAEPPAVGGTSRRGARPGRGRLSSKLTGEEITVRQCQPGDVPAVLDLWEQARSGHASTADRLDDVKRLASDSPAALLVAEREDEIVGALIAAWDGWRGNMYRLAVRADRRRQGIG